MPDFSFTELAQAILAGDGAIQAVKFLGTESIKAAVAEYVKSFFQAQPQIQQKAQELAQLPEATDEQKVEGLAEVLEEKAQQDETLHTLLSDFQKALDKAQQEQSSIYIKQEAEKIVNIKDARGSNFYF